MAVNTRTATKSITRTIARKAAIVETLRFVSKFLKVEGMDKFIDQGVEELQYVERFMIQSIDTNSVVFQELVVSIDWDKHEVFIQNGNEEIVWNNAHGLIADISTSFLDALSKYKRNHSKGSFSTKLLICFRRELHDVAEKHFGTTPAKPVYASDMVNLNIGFERLEECSATLQFSKSISVRASIECSGKIVHLSADYGFVRPDEHDGLKDFWFSRKADRTNYKLGEAVFFLARTKESGRRVAERIKRLSNQPKTP